MKELQKDILTLLNKLKRNNNREWYHERKEQYKEMLQNFLSFGQELEKRLNEFDKIDRLKLYRPYRDLRFSKDKTPYHIYRGISFFRQGKGEYYFQIEPDKCCLIIGYWDINPQDLKRIREEFLYDVDEIKEILNEPKFQEHFKTLEPFELKTAPKGFDKNHPNIEFIRKKSILVRKRFSNEEIFEKDFFERVVGIFKIASPLLYYLNDVLSTDSNGVPLEELE